MSRQPYLCEFVIFCLLAGGLAPGVAASAAELRSTIDAIRNEHGISATAYFIVSPDSVEILQALGTTGWNTDAPFEVGHLVRIGSITKTFTALAAMILAERGELALHTPLRQIFPQPPFDNPWPQKSVRVEHLLKHTAGLRDLSKKEFDFNEPVSLAAAWRVDPGSRRLLWPPELHSSYSNSGAGIVSGAIEKATGRSYEAFVKDEIFTPLGMSSARFAVAAKDRHRLISGYDRDGRTPIDYWHTLYRAFGGISVTPFDMMPFVQLFLNRGQHGKKRLLGQASIKRMQSPHTTLAARSGLDYGYGLGIYQFQHGGVSFYGHGGDADGYLAFFAYSPAIERGYFVVINAFNNTALRQMRRVIEDALVDTPAAEPPVMSLDDTHLKILSGTYRQATYRFGRPPNDATLDVLTDDDRVFTSAASRRRRELIAVSPWHFRRREQSVATIAFIPCGDRLYLQGDFGNYVKQVDGELLERCPQ